MLTELEALSEAEDKRGSINIKRCEVEAGGGAVPTLRVVAAHDDRLIERLSSGIGQELDNRESRSLAVGCSVVISFFWSYWQILFKTSYQPTITLTTAVPYLAGFLIAAVISRFVRSSADNPGLEYTWTIIMRRPIPVDADQSESDAAIRT